jgi:hypothetical protein
MAFGLGLATPTAGWLGTVTTCSPYCRDDRRTTLLMLSKLAYLTPCRSIQLLVLLARCDAAKDLEILVLRHQLTVLSRQTTTGLEPADRALLAAMSRLLPSPLVVLLRQTPTPYCAGTVGWSLAHRPIGTATPAGQRWTTTCSN